MSVNQGSLNESGDKTVKKESRDDMEDCQTDINSLCGKKHQMLVQMLPSPVKRRLKALKKLQLEATNIEAEFFIDIHKLECKYHNIYSVLYKKREDIVSGKYEPTDEECDFPEEKNNYFANEMVTEELFSQLNLEDLPKMDNNTLGIPNFWLTIFKNVAMLNDMVQPHDEPILKHLEDIKVVFLESNPMGFILEFHFSQNEYFTNSVLTKRYEMKCAPSPTDPFSFEGPEIYLCKGCTIDWVKGKNVTMKTIKKRQKHRSKGAVRTVMKVVQNDSFFNFFTPPAVPENADVELDEDTQALLTSDFEIGHYIREQIVPHAVLYYTGEALEDEEEYEEDEESEDELTSDSEDNELKTPDDNKDYCWAAKNKAQDSAKFRTSGPNDSWPAKKDLQNPDCKTQ